METKATCPYCGVGCGVLIEHDGARITGVRGDPAHPANCGRLCTKGATLHLSARPETRLLYPELRTARGEPRQRVGWDAAIGVAAQRFADALGKGILSEHENRYVSAQREADFLQAAARHAGLPKMIERKQHGRRIGTTSAQPATHRQAFFDGDAHAQSAAGFFL